MQRSLDYGNTQINFTVVYRPRKTLAIQVEAPGRVQVLAPLGLEEADLLEAVRSKAPWIVGKLYDFRHVHPVLPPKEYTSGESFLYLGRSYTLEVMPTGHLKKPYVRLYQGKFWVHTFSKEAPIVREALRGWYREKAVEQIAERVRFFAPKIGVQPGQIRVKEQRRIWGSCSAKGNLNFNWKTVMAPSPVLNYIIVHELCHLKHHNHSRKFWDLVYSIMPDYKERKEWLKRYGGRLQI